MGIIERAYNIVSNLPARYEHDTESFSSQDGLLESASLDDDNDETFDLRDYISPTKPSWVLRRFPKGVQTASLAAWDWTKGPNPPRMWKIEPAFPSINTAPLQLLDTYLPSAVHRFWLYAACCTLWLLSFSIILSTSASEGELPGYGQPTRITCGFTFWDAKNACGLNGEDCLPFENQTLAFRCPANCLRNWVLDPRAVGVEEVNYQPLVIGGASPTQAEDEGVYRADSFVCAAAIHAGYISEAEGGCAVVELIGQHTGFTASSRHGITSTAFPSTFPSSFHFLPGITATCRDLRWPLLALTVTFTALLSLFTTSAPAFYFTTFLATFTHVSLVSDPPELASYTALISLALARLLPASFIAYVIYLHVARRTLTHLRGPLEKTSLYLAPLWIGALNNETFDQRIPIQRLTPHDIAQQPGAVPALILIVLIIFSIALGQAWAIRIEGSMRRYLAVYALFILALLICVAVPNMNLRIHHYIIGLLLLPGTAMQNRPSLVYQGLLLGLFINGVARWGFASILSTTEDLNIGQSGSALPVVLAPVITGANITLAWAWPPPRSGLKDVRKQEEKYDGISVLVNDVERFREEISGNVPEVFTWMRDGVDQDQGLPEFFRFAYRQGERTLDYTKAAVWEGNGSWTWMEKGPS